MRDAFGRTLSYLRVSVTDRCNLRCRYCMPATGIHLLDHAAMLTFEEICAVVAAGVRLGITKVRLTGGEPLVRKGIVDLVGALAGIAGIQELCMTTNGLLLAQYAQPLADAGLHRVNVSLDSTIPERFAALTRGGDVRAVFAGIAAAQNAGLTPLKLNCVTGGEMTDADTQSVQQYAAAQGLQVRRIALMDFHAGHFAVVQGGSGGDCPRCNRLRLSSDGMIRPCLFSDLAFSVRDLGAVEALQRAAGAKPQAGSACTHNWMHGIGG